MGKFLSNVAEFVHLGLKIDAKGSLQNSLKFLSEKGMRAWNKKMKIKMIPADVALRLFDACMLPILTYGAEIWAAFERFDFDTSGSQGMAIQCTAEYCEGRGCGLAV